MLVAGAERVMAGAGVTLARGWLRGVGRRVPALVLLSVGGMAVAQGTAAATTTVRGQAERVRGEALYAAGNYAGAERAYAAAEAAGLHDGPLRWAHGMALYRLHRPAEAVALLEDVGAAGASGGGAGVAGERTAEESFALVLCYLDLRQYDGARRVLAGEYGFRPDSGPAYLLAARMLFGREYLPVAAQFAAEALRREPGLPLVHELLGEIALAQQHLPEAEREFEAERRGNPLLPVVYDRLGDTYLRGGEYGKAERALRQAIVLEPGTTAPYILLGKLLLREGDAVGAQGYLLRARGMDPHNFMTHSLLGQALRLEGRTAEAAAERAEAERIQAESETEAARP